MRKTTKRIRILAFALATAGLLGACADQPMAPEQPYEVQMDEHTDTNCIWINGTIHCNG